MELFGARIDYNPLKHSCGRVKRSFPVNLVRLHVSVVTSVEAGSG
jgi:hypothetical protein